METAWGQEGLLGLALRLQAPWGPVPKARFPGGQSKAQRPFSGRGGGGLAAPPPGSHLQLEAAAVVTGQGVLSIGWAPWSQADSRLAQLGLRAVAVFQAPFFMVTGFEISSLPASPPFFPPSFSSYSFHQPVFQLNFIF